MNDIISMDLQELEKIIANYGESKFRAKQLFDWFHSKAIWDYNEMNNLPKGLKEKLALDYPLNNMKIIQKYVSKIDGTIKYLFELPDSHIIESVLMRYKHGNSICISSQVGCKMGCKFCASTLEGLIRNLNVSEMLGQVYKVSQDIGERISNIVIMGSGEPLEYLDITRKFFKMINDEKGHNIGQRHITVSTCGIVPSIYELAKDNLQITLALSLHATSDEKRKAIMPIAYKYTLDETLKACKYYADYTGRRVTFEYALIAGKNDSVEDARELAKLLRGMLCHVNLIPVNPIEERKFTSSSNENVERFVNTLKQGNIEATVRRKLGSDIDAACGQLRRRYIKKRGE